MCKFKFSIFTFIRLIKENGNMNVAYALESSHGSIATSWVYHLMQDMRVNVVAQQHLQNKPFRYASLAAKYINPSTTKKKFDNLTIGADLNIDNLWKYVLQLFNNQIKIL